MRIEITYAGGGTLRADAVGVPGMPPVGHGATDEEAVFSMLARYWAGQEWRKFLTLPIEVVSITAGHERPYLASAPAEALAGRNDSARREGFMTALRLARAIQQAGGTMPDPNTFGAKTVNELLFELAGPNKIRVRFEYDPALPGTGEPMEMPPP